MWWRFLQPQRLRQWQLPATKPTVSAVAAAHCVTFGFKCDGLIMSCIYKAWILSVVRIKAYSRYEYDYLSEIILRRADFQEHMIADKDFKNLYPSDFEDLNLLLLQGHLDHLLGYEFKYDYTIIESPRAVVFSVDYNNRKIMRSNEIYKFSNGTLTHILEALDYRVKEFKVKRLNPGFWTQKDATRSKEFIAAIERRLKTRRIFRNLECFVGGRVHDIDYRLLQRTE
ncbi:hypothetical protein Tco_0470874 [Tanacetum coccineum]